MQNESQLIKARKEKLQKLILQEKAKGTPDIEIGQKYGVTYRYIERLITKSKGINVSTLKVSKKVKTLCPKDFKEERTTVWSFKQRGNWATHSGEYRGNWSPYIPRNVIIKYSKPGELVLDYFCGAGTTAVEAKLLGRKCIALDINDSAIEVTKKNIDFKIELRQKNFLTQQWKYEQIYEPKLMVGDARYLSFLQDNSIDLICAHPPYTDIIHYTDGKEGDLSFLDIDDFLREMDKVAKESYRVLRPGRQCAILIGDMRKKKHVIPLGFKLMDVYLNAGFKLRELIIKRQHNCKSTGFWYTNSIKYNFLLLAHEYLPVFEKPKSSVPSSIKERGIGYGMFFPTLEQPPRKRKLDEFETTTVWVLPEKDFEKCLNKNVIERYSNKNGYFTVSFISHSENTTYITKDEEKSRNGLLFIKLPFLKNNSSYSNIKFCLQKVKEIINQHLPKINNDGFMVIQTRDVRINGYIESIAKRIIETFSFNKKLWLREIITVAKKNSEPKINISEDYLQITHQYLLVYDVIKGGKRNAKS